MLVIRINLTSGVSVPNSVLCLCPIIFSSRIIKVIINTASYQGSSITASRLNNWINYCYSAICFHQSQQTAFARNIEELSEVIGDHIIQITNIKPLYHSRSVGLYYKYI